MTLDFSRDRTMINCPLCGESVSEIERHVDEAHSSIYCPTCQICSLRTEPETVCMGCKQVLSVQVKTETSQEEVRPTESSSSGPDSSLPSSSSSSSSLVRLRAGKQPVQCYLCRQWFHNKELNIIHQVIIHGLLHCKFCDQVFSNEEDKKKHDLEKHNVFSCKQCRQNFSSSKLLIKHRAERHRLAACNFCDYNFTAADFEAHHLKTHRIKQNFFQSFAPDIYYETRPEVFSTTNEKLRLKCLLCDKTLKSCKLINHIKYFHNFSNFALLEAFSNSSLKYNFSDGSLTQDTSTSQVTEENCVVIGTSNPNEEYNCHICNVVFADCGAHLLFQHNLRRCRNAWCEKYFLTEQARQQHEDLHHKQEYNCSVCSTSLSSQYKLVVHRWFQHNMQTCVFCDSIILTSLEPFANHLSNFHYIKNQTLVHNAKKTPVIFRLLNLALVKFDKANRKVECGLCDSVKLDCGNGGEELVRHLVDFHRIKNPSRSLFSLFNGKEFHYHTMKNSDSDIVREPQQQQQQQQPQQPQLQLQLQPQQQQQQVQPSGSSMLLVQRVRLNTAGMNILERALTTGSGQIKMITNKCIICQKGFQTSEEVQRHLLTEHVSSSTSKMNENTKSQATEEMEEVETGEQLTIKQEDAEIDNNPAYADHATEVEIDDEHFSINNVEVNISEKDNDPLELPCDTEERMEEGPEERPEETKEELEEIVIKEELEYEENLTIVDFPENLEKESGKSSKNDPKTPLDLQCKVCSAVLTSILTFTTHMKKYHKDSEQERNKPFVCDICNQGFHFQSSLNSHKSKAHQETSGLTFRCPLCPSVTNSKNGMRRHLRNSHKKTLLNEELSYKCSLCGDLFWSIAERTVHIAESHKEASEQLEKCNICGHISPNRHALRRHFQRMHPNEPQMDSTDYKCEECDKVFPQKIQLTNHVKAEHCPKSVTYQCTFCPSQFTNKKSLNKHIITHKKEDPPAEDVKFKCEVCEREFNSRKAMKTHFSTSHNEKSKKGFLCKVCNKMFDSATERSLHYKVDHPESNPYLCSVCGLGFVTKNSLYNHRMCHKDNKVHKCQHCGKEFSRRDSFNEHLLIHIGPRHKCPHCPKEFVQKSNLKRHIRIHLGIKPYKCNFCEMTFSDKGACNSHQKTHTGEEREACPICNVVFSKKQKLKYHMRLHTGEGLETCHICNKMFTHTYALNVHMKIHSKENNFMCHKCKKVFQNAKALYQHVLGHSDKSFQCKQCRKKFKYSKLLKRHVLAYHQKVDDLKCSFEQCVVKSKRLEEIRDHVREAHSVKNPIMGSHFSDELGDDGGDENEKDLAAIYDSLDQQIDHDVLNDNDEWTPGPDTTGDVFDVIKEEEPEEVSTSEVEVSSGPSKRKPSSVSKAPRKRKRVQSGEKLVVKIQSRSEKRKAKEVAESEGTDTEVKDEPLYDQT